MSDEGTPPNTGIYGHDAEDQDNDDPVSLRGRVPTGEETLASILEAAATLRERARRSFYFPKTADEKADAIRSFKCLKRLQRWANLFWRQRLAGEDSAFAAMKVGMYIERAGVRLVEGYARAGRASVDAGIKASRETHGDSRENYARIIAIVKARMSKSGISRTDAMKKCAKESQKTDEPFSYGTARRAFKSLGSAQ